MQGAAGDCEGVEVMDWVEELRSGLATIDAADERLDEAMETDPLPLEAVAASEARAQLWEVVIRLGRKT